ncbi:putative transposase [Escherichia coli 6-319-05_S1_C2]|nr:putative transposase [Escherichia coli 6-319-05_S1_C2]
MPAFEWVHVQLHQQKGMISLSPPTICNSAQKWIPAGTKQHGQIKWFFPDINASPLSSAREVSVRCVQFRSA